MVSFILLYSALPAVLSQPWMGSPGPGTRLTSGRPIQLSENINSSCWFNFLSNYWVASAQWEARRVLELVGSGGHELGCALLLGDPSGGS